MRITNVIEECQDSKQDRRDLSKIRGIMVHRCGVDLQMNVVIGYDAPSISDAFTGKNPELKEVAKATGYQNPYSLIIGGNLGPVIWDGHIWQVLPLDEVGKHARRFSEPYIGIGLVCDARKKPVSNFQRASLVDLCAELCIAFGWDPIDRVVGHGEVPGSHDGSKAPGKPAACPGDLLPMNLVRDDILTITREQGHRRLRFSGLVYSTA